MSDEVEVKPTVQQITQEEPVIETTESIPQIPESEVEARAKGWVPKEEFKGNPNLWKTPEQFIEYGKLLDD
jgi:hypothetical protein